jgi:hypothetical protein
MAKTLNGGALISYGPTLPTPSVTPDGALFYKTDSISGGQQGLYMFGFIRDASSNILGYQVAQDWTPATSPDLYVLKGGDTMIGALTVPTYIRITQVSGAQRLVIGNQDGGGINKPSIIEASNGVISISTGDNWSGSGGTFNTSQALVINGAGATGLTFRGAQVWHMNNDGAGSGLDADLLDGNDSTFFLNVSNMNAGVLSPARGGTGNTTAPASGGILYGASGTVSSVAGTSGQVLLSGGAAAPTWANQSTLSVGYATTAGNANFATSATNAVNATIAASMQWSGVLNITTALVTTASTPASGFTTYSRPSFFYDMGSSGVKSMTPPQFQTGSISGFDGFSTSDMGQYQVGFTSIGLGGNGARSVQIAANWNAEEASPTNLRYRVNDDTSDVTQWGAFRTIWDQGNLTSFSQLGLTNVSQLTNDAAYINSTALALKQNASSFAPGAILEAGRYIDMHGGGGAAHDFDVRFDCGPGTGADGQGALNISAASTTVTALTATSSLTTPNATIGQVKSTANLHLDSAGSGNAVYLNYFSGGSGVVFGNGATGVVGTMTGSGDLNINGNFVANGNVSAFSDARIKKDIQRIIDPIGKVKLLNGVTYTRLDNEERGTGLIAQDVQAVLSEAVAENQDGMLSVMYGNLVGLLVEAIKDQQKQIDGLMFEVEQISRRKTHTSR